MQHTLWAIALQHNGKCWITNLNCVKNVALSHFFSYSSKHRIYKNLERSTLLQLGIFRKNLKHIYLSNVVIFKNIKWVKVFWLYKLSFIHINIDRYPIPPYCDLKKLNSNTVYWASYSEIYKHILKEICFGRHCTGSSSGCIWFQVCSPSYFSEAILNHVDIYIYSSHFFLIKSYSIYFSSFFIYYPCNLF